MLRANLLDQGVKKSHDNSIFNVESVTENIDIMKLPKGLNEYYKKMT